MSKTIYHCCKRIKGVPEYLDIVHYANTEAEAIKWLENNGGGIYKNDLHNFQFEVKAK